MYAYGGESAPLLELSPRYFFTLRVSILIPYQERNPSGEESITIMPNQSFAEVPHDPAWRKRWGAGFAMISTVTAAAIMLTAALDRIPQDPAYHEFADGRSFLGIPNFGDVISNLPFVVIGLLGLWAVASGSLRGSGAVIQKTSGAVIEEPRERWVYLAFYLGAVLTGFGSAYYHLWPDNETLVWDRLPMTVVFMSLLASVISERISVRAGLLLLFPLLAVGAASVVYWIMSEHRGMGDLRPYIFIQGYPGLLILLILAFFPSRYTRGGYIFPMLALYALAKAAEVFDSEILGAAGVLSGHTIKHLLAAAAIAVHLRMLTRRKHRGLRDILSR
jgi:hypothetical protein